MLALLAGTLAAGRPWYRSTPTVALDWNDGTRPYKVAYSDVQGHHTAAEVAAARDAATEKAAAS